MAAYGDISWAFQGLPLILEQVWPWHHQPVRFENGLWARKTSDNLFHYPPTTNQIPASELPFDRRRFKTPIAFTLMLYQDPFGIWLASSSPLHQKAQVSSIGGVGLPPLIDEVDVPRELTQVSPSFMSVSMASLHRLSACVFMQCRLRLILSIAIRGIDATKSFSLS